MSLLQDRAQRQQGTSDRVPQDAAQRRQKEPAKIPYDQSLDDMYFSLNQDGVLETGDGRIITPEEAHTIQQKYKHIDKFAKLSSLVHDAHSFKLGPKGLLHDGTGQIISKDKAHARIQKFSHLDRFKKLTGVVDQVSNAETIQTHKSYKIIDYKPGKTYPIPRTRGDNKRRYVSSNPQPADVSSGDFKSLNLIEHKGKYYTPQGKLVTRDQANILVQQVRESSDAATRNIQSLKPSYTAYKYAHTTDTSKLYAARDTAAKLLASFADPRITKQQAITAEINNRKSRFTTDAPAVITSNTRSKIKAATQKDGSAYKLLQLQKSLGYYRVGNRYAFRADPFKPTTDDPLASLSHKRDFHLRQEKIRTQIAIVQSKISDHTIRARDATYKQFLINRDRASKTSAKNAQSFAIKASQAYSRNPVTYGNVIQNKNFATGGIEPTTSSQVKVKSRYAASKTGPLNIDPSPRLKQANLDNIKAGHLSPLHRLAGVVLSTPAVLAPKVIPETLTLEPTAKQESIQLENTHLQENADVYAIKEFLDNYQSPIAPRRTQIEEHLTNKGITITPKGRSIIEEFGTASKTKEYYPAITISNIIQQSYDDSKSQTNPFTDSSSLPLSPAYSELELYKIKKARSDNPALYTPYTELSKFAGDLLLAPNHIHEFITANKDSTLGEIAAATSKAYIAVHEFLGRQFHDKEKETLTITNDKDNPIHNLQPLRPLNPEGTDYLSDALQESFANHKKWVTENILPKDPTLTEHITGKVLRGELKTGKDLWNYINSDKELSATALIVGGAALVTLVLPYEKVGKAALSSKYIGVEKAVASVTTHKPSLHGPLKILVKDKEYWHGLHVAGRPTIGKFSSPNAPFLSLGNQPQYIPLRTFTIGDRVSGGVRQAGNVLEGGQTQKVFIGSDKSLEHFVATKQLSIDGAERMRTLIKQHDIGHKLKDPPTANIENTAIKSFSKEQTEYSLNFAAEQYAKKKIAALHGSGSIHAHAKDILKRQMGDLDAHILLTGIEKRFKHIKDPDKRLDIMKRFEREQGLELMDEYIENFPKLKGQTITKTGQTKGNIGFYLDGEKKFEIIQMVGRDAQQYPGIPRGHNIAGTHTPKKEVLTPSGVPVTSLSYHISTLEKTEGFLQGTPKSPLRNFGSDTGREFKDPINLATGYEAKALYHNNKKLSQAIKEFKDARPEVPFPSKDTPIRTPIDLSTPYTPAKDFYTTAIPATVSKVPVIQGSISKELEPQSIILKPTTKSKPSIFDSTLGSSIKPTTKSKPSIFDSTLGSSIKPTTKSKPSIFDSTPRTSYIHAPVIKSPSRASYIHAPVIKSPSRASSLIAPPSRPTSKLTPGSSLIAPPRPPAKPPTKPPITPPRLPPIVPGHPTDIITTTKPKPKAVFWLDFKNRPEPEKRIKRKPRDFIGNVPHDKIIGVYARKETTYGAANVIRHKKRDVQKRKESGLGLGLFSNTKTKKRKTKIRI